MENLSTVTTAVCKTLQSLGISPRKEHQIENALVRQIESSGPEFVLKRLGSLADWRKLTMTGVTNYHPEWMRYKNHYGETAPADSIGSQLWGLPDKTFFTVCGSLRKAVELLIPSEKQLTKWLEGVRCEKTDEGPKFHMDSYSEDQLVNDYERDLEDLWVDRPWFNVSDISGRNIPGSGKFMSLRNTTTRVDGRVVNLPYVDPQSLVSAFNFTLSTAPLFTWQFLDDIGAPELMGASSDESEAVVGSLQNLVRAKKESPVLLDEAIMGSSQFGEEFVSSGLIDHKLGLAHSVGNIGFLQQPNGKLRTVANPNRFVQWCNIPLGELLAVELHRRGCFVYNQEKGMKTVQLMLREGISVSSFDMSSATDRLDYSRWLHEKFNYAYTNPDQVPLLARSLELFEDTSSAPWTIPGHIADMIGAHSNEISWSVGQPLGLRPSFPILSLMNCDFAEKAFEVVEGRRPFKHGHKDNIFYVCVGDDLVIQSKYAEAYMSVVRDYNGKINNEKTMESDRYAEFCSHLITRGQIYPIKPRWELALEGSTQNVEKFTTFGLHPKVPTWTFKVHNTIAAHSISGMKCIPYSVTSQPLDLDTRVATNTLIATCHPGPRDRDTVTLQTLDLRSAESEARKGEMPIRELSTSSANDAYQAFGGSGVDSVDLTYATIHPHIENHLGSISTDKSTSVDVPVFKDWDRREGCYKQPESKLTQDKTLARMLARLKVNKDDGLVETTTVSHGVETTIIVDTLPEIPQAIVSHRRLAESIDSKPSAQAVQVIPVPKPVAEALSERRAAMANELLPAGDEFVLEDDNPAIC